MSNSKTTQQDASASDFIVERRIPKTHNKKDESVSIKKDSTDTISWTGDGMARHCIKEHSLHSRRMTSKCTDDGNLMPLFGIKISKLFTKLLLNVKTEPDGNVEVVGETEQIIIMPATIPNNPNGSQPDRSKYPNNFTFILGRVATVLVKKAGGGVDSKQAVLTDFLLDYSDPCPRVCPDGFFDGKNFTAFKDEFPPNQNDHDLGICTPTD